METHPSPSPSDTDTDTEPGLRLFLVYNETTHHGLEVDASSHADAESRYRARFDVQGFACIKTSDAEVFFGFRKGVLHKVHLTYAVDLVPRS